MTGQETDVVQQATLSGDETPVFLTCEFHGEGCQNEAVALCAVRFSGAEWTAAICEECVEEYEDHIQHREELTDQEVLARAE